MIIDHIGIPVKNYEESKDFYSKVLKHLDIELVMEYGGWAGLGKNKKPEFWFGEDKDADKVMPQHIAFLADTREQVDKFYEEAIKLGAKDNGKPGVREHYHPNYYGAFVIDLNGFNLEAVCHKG